MSNPDDDVSTANKRHRTLILLIVLFTSITTIIALVLTTVIIATQFGDIGSFVGKDRLVIFKDILSVVGAPLTGLFGAALGFYFSYRR